VKIEIKHRIDGKIIFAHDCENNTIKLTVEAAVKAKVSLAYASLAYARLDGASLVGARLVGASLVGARLVGARLVGARLVGASLVGLRPNEHQVADGLEWMRRRQLIECVSEDSTGKRFRRCERRQAVTVPEPQLTLSFDA
jgi:uncharacterized protein YjbI with pentapeptide repeats